MIDDFSAVADDERFRYLGNLTSRRKPVEAKVVTKKMLLVERLQ